MTHRCIIGLGGSLSADFPLFRAHVGRAFVEHVAEAHGFGPWRPTSAALADFAEHGSGIVLCRLWHDSASGASSAPMAAKQCLKYVGVRSSDHFVIAQRRITKIVWEVCCHGRNPKSTGVGETSPGRRVSSVPPRSKVRGTAFAHRVWCWSPE